MPDTPFLSIIVPVYKTEEFLPACIESILNQNYIDFELILIDDGSPDSSGNICDLYAGKDKRIVVHHKANGGASSARNEGIKLVRGKYIGWVDSDDTINQEMYHKLVSLATEHDADIAECQFLMINNGKTERSGREEGISYGNSDFILHQFFSAKMKPGLTTKIYKSELWSGVSFPMGRIHQDCYVNMRFALMPLTYVRCSDPLYNYFIRTNSITTTFSAREIRQAIYLFEYTGKLANNFSSDVLRKRYLEMDAVNRLLCRYFEVNVNSAIANQKVYNKYIRKRLGNTLPKYLLKAKLPLKTKISLILLLFNCKRLQGLIHRLIS